jgi:DNA (cytosine-5)-methyltransferase 1
LPDLPLAMVDGLKDFLESIEVHDPRWWSSDSVNAYVDSLSPLQRERFDSLKVSATITYRTAYRRMRRGVPRWEMRNDGIAGCLRTAGGGSSKQAVVELGNGAARIRWMTPREYAALMGAPDFPLNGVAMGHEYTGFGDAVCAPVVTWLSDNYLLPVLRSVPLAVGPGDQENSEPHNHVALLTH